MNSPLWCWSDIVNPQLLEAAMADEARRARQKQQTQKPGASNDFAGNENDHRPVAA